MTSSSSLLPSCHVLLVGSSDWTHRFANVVATRTEGSVRTVPTVDAALSVSSEDHVNCVITEYDLGSSTGIDLLRSIRETTETLPVILCTAAGGEGVASDAVAAGVTDYVVLSEPFEETFEKLLERADQSVRTARRKNTQRDRARQFDAIFHDTRTVTWVLDPDGSLARVNQTASDLVAAETEALIGDEFWTLPWWAGSDETRLAVERIVDRARSGEFGHEEVTRDASAVDDFRTIDLSARPVRDEHGEMVSIVVEGVDITERVSLERDLRRSEELHRVTLNNMTDTVLITNESGEYTYVCPNVHFIFGYTADEIRERGTIDDLLGEDLFGRDELAAKGVLKNIECTVTDKAGHEHTLLVNVREVSIQGGTLLYSCRDITKRKQREEALATLHETARDFLYAETPQEIAHHIVDDVPSVLDFDASAVYLFDADDNELYPAAHSSAMRRLNGPLQTVPTDGEGLVSHSFLEDESLFFDDVHSSERLENPASSVRSAAYIPLGDHGVFVPGSPDVGRFDEVTRELADLLAATAEAALDRIKRESQLREQERELQRQNDQLTTLNRINGIIREIDQALVQAETEEEIDHTVCELLTDNDRFAFAWIGTADSRDGSLEPRAWAGAEQGYLDSVSMPIERSNAEPAGRTAATREVTTIPDVAERLHREEWRKEALTRDYLSVLSVPLAYDELTYGVLTVYAEAQNAFDETSQAVLAELGETIASATSAIERKNALLTTSTTRVEFDVDDPTFVLSRLAQEAECDVSYQGGVRQAEEGTYVFVDVEGAPVDAIEDVARELIAVDEVRRISTDKTGGVLRLRITEPFVALELADHGAILRSVTATPTVTTLVIDLPESANVRHVTRLVTDSFDHTELRSKQTFDRSSTENLYSRFLDQLTERQLEVIQTAYYSGFFESPRDNTGEDVAETLGISPPAFYQHTRTVQRKLFSTLFDDIGIPVTSTPSMHS